MPTLKRFVVSERSMTPTLVPGDGLVAVRSRHLRRGQIRVFPHPSRADFWLVKRVGDVRGHRFDARSDNPVGAVDSRQFGDVSVDDSYRVLFRVPARFSGRRA